MRTQREPTHTLTVVVPLNLDDESALNYLPVSDALNIVMSLSRIAVDGVWCGNATVSLDPVSALPGQEHAS